MRYFIYYPPKKTIRLIDASRNVLVDDILDLVKKEFSLNVEDSRPAETVLVLNYNGAELKGKWSLLDLGIPSGSIIRCIHREILEAQIHVHCDFNKQILKLFDHSITAQTTIGVIRQKISDKIGLPLSTFCLQRFDDQKRLFDSDTLEDRQIKVHGHVLLKVWSGYEKLISSCVKGFSETYSSDDLTRYYQIQIALYISAFYGIVFLSFCFFSIEPKSSFFRQRFSKVIWNWRRTLCNSALEPIDRSANIHHVNGLRNTPKQRLSSIFDRRFTSPSKKETKKWSIFSCVNRFTVRKFEIPRLVIYRIS